NAFGRNRAVGSMRHRRRRMNERKMNERLRKIAEKCTRFWLYLFRVQPDVVRASSQSLHQIGCFGQPAREGKRTYQPERTVQKATFLPGQPVGGPVTVHEVAVPKLTLNGVDGSVQPLSRRIVVADE